MEANGNGHPKLLHFPHPPKRVVSLVPSITESMFTLGFGERVVGITDYCVHPSEALANLPRIGGTKNPRVEDILSLQPELVIANMEENTPQTVEALEAEGVQVWVTFPKTVQDAMDLLWTLVGLYMDKLAAIKLETLELTLDWARTAGMSQEPVRYFCPIWFERLEDGTPWWMTFNAQTYTNDLIGICGGENVFSGRERLYPLGADLGRTEPLEQPDRDKRYPRVRLEEIVAANPTVVILPDEPFPFDDSLREEMCSLLEDVDAVKNDRVFQVDGSLITWHGTRLALALRELPALFDRLSGS